MLVCYSSSSIFSGNWPNKLDRIYVLVSICITCIDLGNTYRFGNGMDARRSAIDLTVVDHVAEFAYHLAASC